VEMKTPTSAEALITCERSLTAYLWSLARIVIDNMLICIMCF